MKIGKSSHSPCGFTLVELLVIIAIVLVIVLLAVPVNRKDKAKADRIKCVNNLKNVGLSFRIFATDNGDRYPMALSAKEAVRWTTWIQQKCFGTFKPCPTN